MTDKSYRTLAYILNRTLLWFDQKLYPKDPWIPRRAINYISHWLKPSYVGLEFGSGRSTIWFAQRVEKIWSVESDIDWFNKLNLEIGMLKLKNISYHFHPVDLSVIPKFDQPYVKVINQIPDNGLDFGFVDGEIRDVCAMALTTKIRSGGILIVDNIERYLPSQSKSPESIGPDNPPTTGVWIQFKNIVSNWQCFWMTNGVTDTAIWNKP